MFRADSDGLAEQKKLESLITRYKYLIPEIEKSMLLIEHYSKSYNWKEETYKMVTKLEEINKASYLN